MTDDIVKPVIGQAGHDSRGVVQAVRAATTEIQSSFRVYRKDWLFFSRHASEAEALEHYERSYKGRVTVGSWEVRPDQNGRDFVLWMRVWNVAAERKWEADANTFAAEQEAAGHECRVVTRNSRAEHVLQLDGVVKLKADPS